MSVQSALTDIAKGLWAGLMLAANYAKDWWDTAPLKSRYVAGGVLAVMLLLMSTCVLAEDATSDTNYGVLKSATPGYVYVCHLQNGVPESGVITVCLHGELMPNGNIAMDGSASYCTLTDMRDNEPYYECGTYEEIKAKTIGI